MATLESTGEAPTGSIGQSGVLQADTDLPTEAQARALAAIATLNQAFRAKTDSLLSLPLSLLVQQRDSAVYALEEAKVALERDRQHLVDEQDSFIAFLTEDHQKQLATLEQQLTQVKIALERQTALAPIIHAPLTSTDDSELRQALTHAEDRVSNLQEQLENAYREVDESRSDAWRLQEERDEAIRASDDLRIQVMAELDASRDEAVRLQLALDEAQRALEDARDQAREEASRLVEDLESTKSELHERRAEVTRLRDRLEHTVNDYRPSRPPPPPESDELELARAEAKVVRKQLIDAKRELSRVSRELELARAQRGPLYKPTPAGAVRPNTRTGTTQPGLATALGRSTPARAPESSGSSTPSE